MQTSDKEKTSRKRKRHTIECIEYPQDIVIANCSSPTITEEHSDDMAESAKTPTLNENGEDMDATEYNTTAHSGPINGDLVLAGNSNSAQIDTISIVDIVMTLQTGQQMLSGTLAKIANSCDHILDPEERKIEISKMTHSPVAVEALKAYNNTLRIIEKIADRMPTPVQQREQVRPPTSISTPVVTPNAFDPGQHPNDDESTYSVVMKAKEGVTTFPLTIFSEMLKTKRLQVHSWSLSGYDGDFRMWDLQEAQEALKQLTLGSITEGENTVPVTEKFTVKIVIRSAYSLKTYPYGKHVIDNIPWINSELKVNTELMKKSLWSLNGKWIDSEADIDSAEVHIIEKPTNKDNGRFIIQYYVSKGLFDRFIMSNRVKKTIVTEGGALWTSEEIKLDACFNCLTFGHSSVGCGNPKRCKLCGGEHASLKCDASADNRQCFRCVEHNNCSERKLITKHHALSATCTLVDNRKKKLREALRAKICGARVS